MSPRRKKRPAMGRGTLLRASVVAAALAIVAAAAQA
jgi:hypothetical protein